jgi:hypothetical protein
MSLTLETGRRSAKAKAEADAALYATARLRYGGNVTEMKGDAPVGLLLGHVLRVNRNLSDTPPVTKDRRHGFMKASISEANTVKIRTAQLDEPPTCAFVFGREINRAATTLYTTYRSLFTQADENFWKTVYLYVTLGPATFNYVWKKANPSVTTTSKPVLVFSGRLGNWKMESATTKDSTNLAYEDLLYAVNTLTSTPPGWNVTSFKKLVLVDCEYVYRLWELYGPSKLGGFGTLPVLSGNQMLTIMNRVK